MQKLVVGISILLSSLLPGMHAQAKDSSIYYGIGVGSARFSGDAVNDDAFVSGQKLKDSAEAYNIFLGRQINEHVAFELGYVDFGKVALLH